jgi:hypothetical protein
MPLHLRHMNLPSYPPTSNERRTSYERAFTSGSRHCNVAGSACRRAGDPLQQPQHRLLPRGLIEQRSTASSRDGVRPCAPRAAGLGGGMCSRATITGGSLCSAICDIRTHRHTKPLLTKEGTSHARAFASGSRHRNVTAPERAGDPLQQPQHRLLPRGLIQQRSTASSCDGVRGRAPLAAGLSGGISLWNLIH